MNTFVELRSEFMEVYEFQTKANSYEHICWFSVWSYVSLRDSNQSEFWWRHLLSLSLKLSRFTTLKQNRILIKTFVESQFEVMLVYVFQTKVDSYEDISWTSVWSCVRLWVSNQSEFFWRHFLSLSLKLYIFMSSKRKRILMKTFVESHFEVN